MIILIFISGHVFKILASPQHVAHIRNKM